MAAGVGFTPNGASVIGFQGSSLTGYNPNPLGAYWGGGGVLPGVSSQPVQYMSSTLARQAAGQSNSTGTYSSLPGVSPLRDNLEKLLQGMIDKPGLDQATIDKMYQQSAEPLAAREAAATQALTDNATAMGFGNSGDLLAGQRQVQSDYSGQRNALRRDINISAAQDKENRMENAARIGSGYLDTLRTQNRADAAFANNYGGSSGMPGIKGSYGTSWSTQLPSEYFGGGGSTGAVARRGGGANASDLAGAGQAYVMGSDGKWKANDPFLASRSQGGYGGSSFTQYAPNYNTGNTVSGFGNSSNSKKMPGLDSQWAAAW